MASQQEIQDLIAKTMADEALRAAMIEDPAKAAAALGITLSEEQVAAFKASDLSKAEGLDERLSKFRNLRAGGL